MKMDLIPNHWTDDQEILLERLTAPPRLLVACDFDGTLAPLVSRPEEAAMPEATEEVLRHLGSASGVSLAIISGRALADVRKRVSVPVDFFAGNHGLEMAGHGLDGVRAQAAALQPRLAAIAQILSHRLGDIPGLLVEDKIFSISVHSRRVDPSCRNEIKSIVAAITAQDKAFRVQVGHEVVEILPAISWDKGEALKQIAGRLGIPRSAVFYVGDDATDESAFRAVPNGTSISVGALRPSAARWMARGIDDVRRLLVWVNGLRH